jgi:multimeric flavodoxin WrbA
MAKIIGICGSSRIGATEYSLKQALAEFAKMSVDGLGRQIAGLALVLHSGRKALAEKGVTLSYMEDVWHPWE